MSHNDITGDKIKSKDNSDDFRNGWDKINWGGKSEEFQEEIPEDLEVMPITIEVNLSDEEEEELLERMKKVWMESHQYYK